MQIVIRTSPDDNMSDILLALGCGIPTISMEASDVEMGNNKIKNTFEEFYILYSNAIASVIGRQDTAEYDLGVANRMCSRTFNLAKVEPQRA